MLLNKELCYCLSVLIHSCPWYTGRGLVIHRTYKPPSQAHRPHVAIPPLAPSPLQFQLKTLVLNFKAISRIRSQLCLRPRFHPSPAATAALLLADPARSAQGGACGRHRQCSQARRFCCGRNFQRGLDSSRSGPIQGTLQQSTCLASFPQELE